MIKIIALIEAKPGLSQEEFRDYYEHHHVPLARRLLPMVREYRRNYLDRAAWAGRSSGLPAPQADVVTETWFEDETAFQAFLRRLAEPAVEAEILADEAKFIKPSTVQMVRVDEIGGPG
jgi:uncharacterized protein (TIGR02118 family)